MAARGFVQLATEEHHVRAWTGEQGFRVLPQIQTLDHTPGQALTGLASELFDGVDLDMHDAAVSRIVLASGNPVKRRATESGFCRVFPSRTIEVASVSVPSGVSNQPRSDAETLEGAANRADGARRARPKADYWVGIEGGIDDGDDGMVAFAWVVVRSPVLRGQSRTGTFPLPTEVAALVRQGRELGEADDIVFGRTNSKQKEGAVGLLTGGVIDRMQLYEPSVVLALIPFRNAELYGP